MAQAREVWFEGDTENTSYPQEAKWGFMSRFSRAVIDENGSEIQAPAMPSYPDDYIFAARLNQFRVVRAVLVDFSTNPPTKQELNRHIEREIPYNHHG